LWQLKSGYIFKVGLLRKWVSWLLLSTEQEQIKTDISGWDAASGLTL